MSREIDALVAEHLMGYTFVSETTHMRPAAMSFIKRSGAFPYSTDIAYAWLVVDQWCDPDLDRFCNITFNLTKPEYDDYWSCAFWNGFEAERYIGNANTAPMAICLAALKAYGITPESVSKDSSLTAGEQ